MLLSSGMSGGDALGIKPLFLLVLNDWILNINVLQSVCNNLFLNNILSTFFCKSCESKKRRALLLEATLSSQ